MTVYDNFKKMKGIWGNLYVGEPEDLPHLCTIPMGKTILISSLINNKLMADMDTGRSQIGIIHLLKNTPIEWYSKLQYFVEISTYVSEYDANRICNEQIVELHNTISYLGIPLHTVNGSYALYMFGDNFSVVNSIVMLSGKLQYHSHILNYHSTWEYKAKGIIKFLQKNGSEKPVYIVTKSCASNTWFPLMKHTLFWRIMDLFKELVVAKGSENRSSNPSSLSS